MTTKLTAKRNPSLSAQQRIDEINTELSALQKRANDLQDERSVLRESLRLDGLRDLIDVPDAVKIRFQHSGDPLSGKVGTLKKIRRTRCDAVFDGTLWDIALRNLIPATEDAGIALMIGGAE